MSVNWRAVTAALVVFLLPLAVAPAVAAPASAVAAAGVVINEIESNGDPVNDWVELTNTGTASVDLTGWTILDNDDSHTPFPVPSGTTLAPGAFTAIYLTDFGLGAADEVRLFAPGATTPVDSYTWAAHATTTYGRCPDGTGDFRTTTTPTRGTANDCSTALKINEVESNGDANGDWIELANSGATAADVSGYVLKDNDDTHSFTIPSGTSIAAGGHAAFYVYNSFGLASADSARLFAADGTTLLDSYSWTAHASTTYGRCPDATGAFTTTTAPSFGTTNACPGDVVTAPWPGGAQIAIADAANVFGTNLSGLAYQGSGTSAPGILWAVDNGPSRLWKLVWDGTQWTPDTTGGWSAGKSLHYPDGTGDPDSEGVTLVNGTSSDGVYVSTERNNSDNTVSRPEILRFDVSGTASTLNATNEWNLTADLPAVGANLGAEAVSWIPDSFLTAHGFVDERTGAAYVPADYPNHGTGLFFAGIEANGMIYGYALDQTSGTFTRVASFSSGFSAVMDLEFEPDTGTLWAECDDTCTGRTATLQIDAAAGATKGHFAVTQVYERPTAMPNINNEGFAITPQTECVNGRKPVFWSDDNNDGGHALRSGTLDCQAPTTTRVAVHPGTVSAAVAPVVAGAGTPTGDVTFTVDGTQVGTAPLDNGVATLRYVVAPTGTRTVTASYAGSSAFAGSADTVYRANPVIDTEVASTYPKTRYGWYRAPVRITFYCTTYGAPLAGACPAPVTLAHSGRGQSVTRTIRAADGGVGHVTVSHVNIDLQRPRVRIAGVHGGTYSRTPPKARCVGSDALSGLAACTLAILHRGRTTTIRATARDRAGNISTTRLTYRRK